MIKTSQSRRFCRKPRTTRLRPSARLTRLRVRPNAYAPADLYIADRHRQEELATTSLLFERLQRALPKDRELATSSLDTRQALLVRLGLWFPNQTDIASVLGSKARGAGADAFGLA